MGYTHAAGGYCVGYDGQKLLVSLSMSAFPHPALFLQETAAITRRIDVVDTIEIVLLQNDTCCNAANEIRSRHVPQADDTRADDSYHIGRADD
jgi:hypothetical protein